MTRSVAAALTILILTACSSSNSAQLPEADFFVSLGQTFGLRVGDTAGVVTSATIDLVRFNGVSQDSRCPQNVTCVQAGNATVVLTVQTELAVRQVSLEVPPGSSAQQDVEELSVTVLEVRPAAMEGVVIDPLNYVVGIRVDEKTAAAP